MMNGGVPVSQEASTPIISNRIQSTSLLPSIELPKSAAANLSPQQPRIARFSNSNQAPIVMTRSIPTSAMMKREAQHQRLIMGFDDKVDDDVDDDESNDDGVSAPTKTLNESRWNEPVKGLPNFGQTCFLNSVLQCLAALDPFLTYLLHISCLIDEQDDLSSEFDDNDTISGWQPQRRHFPQDQLPASFLPTQLLELLIAVNGKQRESQTFIDPRPILVAVSRDHPQFRNLSVLRSHDATLEQQDAQELLQALLGMVVQAAKLDESSSAVPYFANLESIADDRYIDELHAGSGEVASAWGSTTEMRLENIEAVKLGTDAVHTAQDCNGECYYDCNVSNESVLCRQPQNGFGQSADSSQSDSDDDYMSTNQDEKKDEYHPHIPHVSSEESLLSQRRPLEHFDVLLDDISISPLPGESMSSSAASREQKRTAAMRMMMASTSSITPSPFCGWLGSSLRCSVCKHVRPIQNAPFFDIPVIPTAVAGYLSGSVRSHRHKGIEPVKYSPTNGGPPCSLEEMLLQFTEVERVHDVECRNCTLQREIRNWEEEILLLEEGIKAKLTRAKRAAEGMPGMPGIDEDPAKQFRDDLIIAQQKLEDLLSTSPDEDGALERVVASGNYLVDESFPASYLSIEREDAYKRLLLTRLPSILAIHVQRRFYDPATNRMSKTAQHVVFPEYLDVAPFCVYGGGSNNQAQWAGSATSNLKGFGTQSTIIFQLQALIEHHGGAFSGHYISYRRHPVDKSWFRISDDAVRAVSWEQVRATQAYMLFYEAV
ncbi:hypothetical protein MPSEU_000794300 [Mayamaea pseudoterrestris]|nr:hypothetical protein MPSEU_000794300 [Mayamaea pseudoterrestris]